MLELSVLAETTVPELPQLATSEISVGPDQHRSQSGNQPLTTIAGAVATPAKEKGTKEINTLPTQQVQVPEVLNSNEPGSIFSMLRWLLPTQATPASDASGVGHYSDFNDNCYSDFSSTQAYPIHNRTSSFGDGTRQPPHAGGQRRALSDSASLGLPGSSAELDANVFEDEPPADDATNPQAQQLLRPPLVIQMPSPALLAPLWPYTAGLATSPVFSSPSSLSPYPTSDEGGSSPFHKELLPSAGNNDFIAHGASRQPTIRGVDDTSFAMIVDAESDLLNPLEISLQSFSLDSLGPLVAAWANELPMGEEFEKGHIAEYRADELPFPPSPQPQQHLLSPQPQSYGPSPILECVDPTALQLPVRSHSTPISIQIIEALEDPLPFPLSPLPPPSLSEFRFGLDFWSALSATRSPTVTPQLSLLNYSAQSVIQ
ncbi:hypothetical protein C8F01DRAFT_1380904 [Mycena amicta]|nr:hypothetical protein C8F01DRAFT_1380904 [Mycena amicta]